MSMGGLFGGATGESENTSTDDFKIANSEDIDFLGSILWCPTYNLCRAFYS